MSQLTWVGNPGELLGVQGFPQIGLCSSVLRSVRTQSAYVQQPSKAPRAVH